MCSKAWWGEVDWTDQWSQVHRLPNYRYQRRWLSCRSRTQRQCCCCCYCYWKPWLRNFLEEMRKLVFGIWLVCGWRRRGMGFGIYTSEKWNNVGFFRRCHWNITSKGEKAEEEIRILLISFVNRWIWWRLRVKHGFCMVIQRLRELLGFKFAFLEVSGWVFHWKRGDAGIREEYSGAKIYPSYNYFKRK